MSGEFAGRLKAARPDVDWDAELAAARARRDQAAGYRHRDGSVSGMTDPRPVLAPGQGRLCASLLAGYLTREGLLEQMDEEQVNALARAFTYAFAAGVGAERGEADGAEAVRRLRGLER